MNKQNSTCLIQAQYINQVCKGQYLTTKPGSYFYYPKMAKSTECSLKFQERKKEISNSLLIMWSIQPKWVTCANQFSSCRTIMNMTYISTSITDATYIEARPLHYWKDANSDKERCLTWQKQKVGNAI